MGSVERRTTELDGNNWRRLKKELLQSSDEESGSFEESLRLKVLTLYTWMAF